MSILGLGSDIINIQRIEKILKNNKEKFLKKIFNPKESIPNQNITEFVAKNFAVKEAFSKALGSGIGKVINFKEILVSRNRAGAPIIKLVKKAELRILKKFKVKKVNYLVSISDDYPFAFAIVVISK
ncbi:MAG: holo-[acyl-carrier-protein] synthase [Candidatus Pelagibacter sp.]|nr:holo-[acyl-carrier-protein] synthase [Candidatus Pelagibacter sp.]